MAKLYQRNHIIFCDLKKRVTVTVEQKEPSGTQLEKSLDISLTDDSDLYFLFTAKIYATDYQRLKDQQGLLVEYNAFGQMLIDLITKCSNEEESASPRYILQFSESSSPHMLRIIETTDFRHLTHLAVELNAANDEALKAYLVSYIRKKQNEYETTIGCLRKSELCLNANLQNSEQVVNEVSQRLRDIKLTNDAELMELRRKHELEMQSLKEASEANQASLMRKHYSQFKESDDAHATATAALQYKLDSQNSELQLLISSNHDLSAKVTSLNYSIAEKEKYVDILRKENDALKIELTSQNNQRQHFEIACSQLTSKLNIIEGDLNEKVNKLNVLEVELNTQKERTKENQEDLKRKCNGVDKLEKMLRQQTTELAKANSIIKQTQKDLKSSQTKAKLRGQVATEQEKILATKEAEAEETLQSFRKLQNELKEAKDLQVSAQEKVIELEKSLSEAQKTIKSNENIINWLNRQISESYSSNLQQRLKSSGVPITGVGIFDYNSTQFPYGGDSCVASANDAAFLSNPPLLPYSASVKLNLSRNARLTAADNNASAVAPNLAHAVSPGLNSASSGSGRLVVLPDEESVASRPTVRLSAPIKPATSIIRRDHLANKPPTSANNEIFPGNARTSAQFPTSSQPFSFLPKPVKSTPSKENGESPFQPDSYLEERDQQSITSAYFPQASIAR